MVRILPGPSNPERQRIINAKRTNQTANAASGLSAARLAYEREQENKAANSKSKTVKVDSNPVKPGKTTVSPMANARGRILGAGGLLGAFSTKQVR